MWREYVHVTAWAELTLAEFLEVGLLETEKHTGMKMAKACVCSLALIATALVLSNGPKVAFGQESKWYTL